MVRKLAKFAYLWTLPFVDPVRTWNAMRALRLVLGDYFRYRRHEGAEPLRLSDMQPSLHERLGAHEFDPHYFYVNAWASRRIAELAPRRHVDVASQLVLPTVIAASVPVTYIDYRPLFVRVSGLTAVAGDLLGLPLRDGSVASLSCLHVAEHVGLGRYGDRIDPAGTRRAAAELARVLAPRGNLLFAVPVGRQRVVFNAHRVHAAETIRDYFPSLTLQEFSGVDDQGNFHERAALDAFRTEEYGLGMFWFTKPSTNP